MSRKVDKFNQLGFKTKININPQILFFSFSFLFILIVWVKVAHVPWRNCTRSAAWMVWPTGLGHLPPFLPVPWWCVEGGAAGHGSFALSICLSLCCGCGCGWEGEGVRTPLEGLRTICVWDWGSYLLGAWTSGPECVTC